MKFKWDVSELTKFADNLRDGWELETALMTATQNIARVLHQNLLNLTPVQTGNLRKMWSAGDNLFFTVEKLKDGYQVTLVNEAKNFAHGNTDFPDGYMYGTDVNDGHRSRSGGWVKGRFFVEDSITQIAESARLEQLIMKELKKWWLSV